MKNSGAIIVSWDFSHGKDNDILLVGKRKNGRVDVINAFQGLEARNLYDKLTGSNIYPLGENTRMNERR